jgi:myxalamid-type polyketide synthase MxaE and MxaD
MLARRVQAVSALEALGASVTVLACDLSREGELERCLTRYTDAGGPEVRGVFHAAGVFRLEPLATQDVASVHEEIAAKALAAWRLHQWAGKHPLDCFVMFSSASALFNTPEAGVYAAGNAILDALAHNRHAQGLAALSVNWGIWDEVGMAARDTSARAPRGMGRIGTAKGLAALSRLLDAGDVQAAVTPMDWAVFREAYPTFISDPFLTAMAGSPASAANKPPSDHWPMEGQPLDVGAYVRAAASRVLGTVPDRLDAAMPLSAYGMDSLMAVQLKSRIEADLGASLPIIRFLHGPSVQELTTIVLEAAPPDSPWMQCQAEEDIGWEDGTL